MTVIAEHPMNPPRRGRQILLLALIVSGLLLRFALLSVSKGSTDAFFWERIAERIVRLGLYETYRVEGSMNNPPLPGLYAGWVYSLSRSLDVPFQPLFKLLFVASDVITCILLFLIYRCRGSVEGGLLAAAAFAWSLNAILISAHHCNTDSVYVMLCLTALWLAETQSRPFLAGLALGAAINVKLLPALLLIPFLGLSRSRKELLWMLFGLAILSIPYGWMLLDLGHRFRSRVLGYRPAPNDWGFYAIIEWLKEIPSIRPYVIQLAERYVAQSKLLIFASIALVTLILRNRGETSRYRAIAICIAVFAVITPAFALQYGAIVGAILMAYQLRAGVIFSALHGLRLFCDYYLGWNGELPISSHGGNMIGWQPELFSALAWGSLAVFLFREFSAKLSRDFSKELS